MRIKYTKYPRCEQISKSELCNSPKNATIKKPAFQIGLRLQNGAFYGQLFFGGFYLPDTPEKEGRVPSGRITAP